jgi:hypothetical protein
MGPDIVIFHYVKLVQFNLNYKNVNNFTSNKLEQTLLFSRI